MSGQRTKGQHFVTEAYLKSFSDSGKLYCYRKPDGKFFESSPEKVCKMRYLYETKLPTLAEDGAGGFVAPNLTERVLSYIEGECMRSLKRLDAYVNGEAKEPGDLRDDTAKVAVFAVHLLFRNPKMLKVVRDPIAERIAEGLRKLLRLHGESPDDLKAWSHEAANREALLKWDEGSPQANLTIELLMMDHVFLRDSLGRFVTSCAPVQIRPVGESAGHMLYFPMTPRTSVLFIPREDPPPTFAVDAPAEIVAFFNGYYFTDESIADTCIASSYELLRAFV